MLKNKRFYGDKEYEEECFADIHGVCPYFLLSIHAQIQKFYGGEEYEEVFCLFVSTDLMNLFQFLRDKQTDYLIFLYFCKL